MKLLLVVIVFELLAALCLSLANNKLPSSRRVLLAQRYELLPAQRNVHSFPGILKGEQYRIAFITAIFNGAGAPAEGAGVGDKAKPLQTGSDRIPLFSGASIGSGDYVIKVGLGTPAQDLYLVIDTGSSLAWTQCVPCDVCYDQHDPIFVPASSSSYQQISCGSPQCAQLGSSSGKCVKSQNASTALCEYRIVYLDGSSTTGDFALDALTLAGDDQPVAAAYPFGCGHNNRGLFYGLDGILGFSRDAIAFPAQTKAAFGERFAYCLPDPFSAEGVGYMEFGAAAASSEGGSSTPLLDLGRVPLYVIELQGIEVEGNQVMLGSSSRLVLVDSGTVFTILDGPLYPQVRDAFKQASASLMMKEAPAGAGQGLFDTCYTGITPADEIPRITFTFAGGLAFTLSARTSLVPVDEKGTLCLALSSFGSSSGYSILGNYQQQGRLFTFDIPGSTLSISSNPC